MITYKLWIVPSFVSETIFLWCKRLNLTFGVPLNPAHPGKRHIETHQLCIRHRASHSTNLNNVIVFSVIFDSARRREKKKKTLRQFTKFISSACRKTLQWLVADFQSTTLPCPLLLKEESNKTGNSDLASDRRWSKVEGGTLNACHLHMLLHPS